MTDLDRTLANENIKRADRGSYYPRIRAHPAALQAWISVAIIVAIIVIFAAAALRHGGL